MRDPRHDRTCALLFAAGVSAVLLAPTEAAANGRFPASNAIFFSPSDPSFVGVRATFGVLLSHDGGATWRWLCEDVLGLGPKTQEDPPMAVTGGGAMVAALSLGLDVSSDAGCDWNLAGGALSGQVVADLAVRPDRPHAVVAVTATYAPNAGEGGGPGYVQQVYESTDDGAHWSALGNPIDPSALVTTIDVAATDANRLYASAIRHGTSPVTASLFVSDDAGATWTEYPLPLDVGRKSTAVFIAGVDPTNADRVYVRSDGASQLSVTSDGGRTWSTPLSLADPMLGFALSGDGATVYAGSVAAGLLAADANSLSFRQVSSVHVQCLTAHAGALWACSDEPSGFVVGQSNTGGLSFAPRLGNLLDIEGPVDCPAGSGASLCTSFDYDAAPPYDPLASLCTNLGACAQPAPLPFLSAACADAGECAPPADAGPPGPSRASGACGCSSAGVPAAAGFGLALGVLTLAGLRRVRARS